MQRDRNCYLKMSILNAKVALFLLQFGYNLCIIKVNFISLNIGEHSTLYKRIREIFFVIVILSHSSVPTELHT